jgi:hypothetical protein
VAQAKGPGMPPWVALSSDSVRGRNQDTCDGLQLEVLVAAHEQFVFLCELN